MRYIIVTLIILMSVVLVANDQGTAAPERTYDYAVMVMGNGEGVFIHSDADYQMTINQHLVDTEVGDYPNLTYLNILGRDGWQVADCFQAADGTVCYMMR